MELQAYREQLAQVLQIIQHLFGVESAVFDSSASLVVCSSQYLEKKGTTVHKPSILEVIEQDEVTVVRPGQMPSCAGCRFNGNCPATLEILKRITQGSYPVGVLSFSAFSQSGHDRMAQEPEFFKRTISAFASLISTLLRASPPETGLDSLDSHLAALSELAPGGLLLTDRRGNIVSMNAAALELLSGSCLKSIHDFLPAPLAELILEGERVEEQVPADRSVPFSILSVPVRTGGEVTGFAIRLNRRADPRLKARLPDADTMRGSGVHMSSVRRRMARVINSPSSVYISGETGTGKGLLAKSIHLQGERRDRPFITISCANIPETLFESELFGYEEGSFTGAKKGGKMGKIELAQGGVLFLDELGEMPMSIQPKFLRVLQEYELSRVGSTETIRLNIRIIAATNRNLRDLIQEGRFREDLYYRINVINLALPPLRQHREDIMPITHNYLEQLRTKLEMPLKAISPEAQAVLMEYDWPGNVRELQNAVEYAANLCSEEVLTPKDLPGHLAAAHSADTPREPPEESSEEQLLRELLIRYGYTLEGKKLIAAHMGISLRTLYRRLERFHI